MSNNLVSYINGKLQEYDKYSRRAKRIQSLLSDIALVGATNDHNKYKAINKMIGGAANSSFIKSNKSQNPIVDEEEDDDNVEIPSYALASKTSYNTTKNNSLYISNKEQVHQKLNDLDDLVTTINQNIFKEIKENFESLKIYVSTMKSQSHNTQEIQNYDQCLKDLQDINGRLDSLRSKMEESHTKSKTLNRDMISYKSTNNIPNASFSKQQ